ncbi:MAG: hypothetical protein R6W90_11830 [Ignavibacteriaceae bacterium]
MKSETRHIILITFFGLLGSIIIGLIFFQETVFNVKMTNFQFVSLGLSGALFFAMLEYKSLKEQAFTVIIILILHLLLFTGREISVTFIIRDIFYLTALFTSIKLYHIFIKTYIKINFYVRSLALVTIYALLNTALGVILFLIVAEQGFPPFGFIQLLASRAILVGLGLGIGIDFYLQNKEGLFKQRDVLIH